MTYSKKFCLLSPPFSRSGKTTRYISEPIEKNEFLQSLDDEEIKWSTSNDGSNRYSKGSTDKKESRKKLEKRCVQSLENHVQYWTDYSKVQFHPLSIYELQNVWYGLTPFEDFGSGRGLLTEPTQAEESQDRLRFFIEECDHLQVNALPKAFWKFIFNFSHF